MKCYLCSPPASMPGASSGQRSTIMHEHHVKQFHLGPYKPFKCTMPSCDQSVTVAPFFASHVKKKHPGTISQPVNSGSKYLDAFTSVMTQYNHYASKNTHLACNMIHAVQGNCDTEILSKGTCKQEDPLPFTITLSTGAPNKHQSPPEASELTVDKGKGRVKKGPVTCAICNQVLSLPSLLKLHEDNKHNLVSDGEYKCEKCPKRFHFYSMYVRHHESCGPDSGKKRVPVSLSKKVKKAKSVQKKKYAMKPSKHAVLGTGKVTHYYCSKCKRTVTQMLVAQHIANVHIKKPFVKCNACDYSTSIWKLSNVQRHIASAHNGNATFTDLRENFTQQLGELRKQLIKRVDGLNLSTYHTRLMKNNNTAGRNMETVRKKMETGGRKMQTAGKKMETAGTKLETVLKKTCYCKKCSIYLRKKAHNVKTHLASLSHIGKYCLHCNGCEFKTLWQQGKMMKHMKRRHKGINVGFTDKRDEIREEIENERKLYIE